jgi:hypothetical protein
MIRFSCIAGVPHPKTQTALAYSPAKGNVSDANASSP